MNRKDFLRLGCCALAAISVAPASAQEAPPAATAQDSSCTFIKNWLGDLMAAIDSELDEPTRIKLISSCGRACYNRFTFKQEIAAKGRGSVNKLIEALKQNFECWREPDGVHIRYGKVSKKGCYCPAAQVFTPKPNDLICHCTQAMHGAIWEAALGHAVQIDILQSVRRGDPTCHFLVHA